MKFSKLIVLSLAVVGLSTTAKGQFGYYNDALLFSQTNFNGTARIQGIGGAQVALGGDISVASSNPAGLGFFNRSVFTFTPSLNFHNSDATYFGQQNASFKTNFNINQLGVVLHYGKGDIVPDKFKGGSLAISLSRTNDFHGETVYEGRNPYNSITDSFIEQAGNVFPDDLPDLAFTAYDQFLIDEADYSNPDDYLINEANGRFYISPNIVDGTIEGYSSLVGDFAGSLPFQNETVRTSGAQYQLNIAWGGNYDDRFYFGGGLGIHTVDYTNSRTYVESDYQFADGSPDDILNSVKIEDNLSINGTGINVNLGVTARPVNFMTVGLSFNSPTFYALNEESEYTFQTDWNTDYSYVFGGDTTDLGFIDFQSDIFTSNYSLRTPARVNGGVAFFLGKTGFITGDVEYVDYSNALLRSNDLSLSEDNEQIDNLYTSVFNYRSGIELRFDPIRVRGGFSYMSDPYAEADGEDRSRQNISFGLGYRNQDFFVDATLIRSHFNELLSPYSVAENSPIAEIQNTSYNAAITLGFVF